MKIDNCTQIHPPQQNCNTSLQAIADTFYAIGGKWKMQIVIALSEKPRRFNELQRILETITPRILSNELKELELNSFITRSVDASVTPVLVQYELAEYSKSLKEVIHAMISWGVAHREKVRGEMKVV